MKTVNRAFTVKIAIAALTYFILLFFCTLLMWSNVLSWIACALLTFVVVVVGIVLCAYILYYAEKHNRSKVMTDTYIDPVTGNINYTKFKLDVNALFLQNPTKKYAVLYSDIKNFKYINDVYGFETGNQVLYRFSNLLKNSGKFSHARINADNFVSVEEYSSKEDLLERCLKRIESVSDISEIVHGMPAITVFVGIYCSEGNNTSLTLEGMIDRANIAQRQIKKLQISGCLIFDESFRTTMLAEQEMENNMKAALENGEFIIYLQPKIDIHTGEIAAAEALVRWDIPGTGVITPINFIPLFERNGFIKKLDTYVFKCVCTLLRKWMDMGYSTLPISANVSKMQLNNPQFLKEYIELKEKYNIPDGLVEIEFTESMLFDNSARMVDVLKFFQSHGFLSSIDDFGSGYSSLNLLKTLPADFLKLDKVFFDTDEYKNRERVIIKNVILMAKELSMQTVAEGVEKWEQVDFLKSVECEMVQGYIFDRPMPIDEFERKYIFQHTVQPLSTG